MRVAVASRDGQTVAGHMGKCPDWVVYETGEAADGGQPRVEEVARITLPKELVFHHYRDDTRHPLAGCAAVIGASAGESFVARMARRGIAAIVTAEPNPARAVADYVRRQVTLPKPRPIGGLICKLHDAITSRKSFRR